LLLLQISGPKERVEPVTAAIMRSGPWLFSQPSALAALGAIYGPCLRMMQINVQIIRIRNAGPIDIVDAHPYVGYYCSILMS
jgi:hypothetical protein